MENHFSSAWFTFILLFFRICFFSIFSPYNFFPLSWKVFLPVCVSLCLLPWVILFCVVILVFLPTMAFVFYHKFMWLTSRLRQAERGRQSAELDNRLFKQDFGDKINALQLEVEELTRHRNQLELELKQERERRLQNNRIIPGKGSQKPEPKTDVNHKIQEESVKLKKALQESHRLHSHLVEEQDQQLLSEKPQMCQLCQDGGSLTKNVCNNCKGTFCNACSTNELPLPSSIKPERICNPCHQHLMKQYSTSPS